MSNNNNNTDNQFQFTVLSQIENNCYRTGKISIQNDNKELKSISTPALLLYTKEGNPINLTKDLLDDLSNNKPLGLHVSFADLFQFSNVLEKFTQGCHKFLSLDQQILFCMVRDSNGFPDQQEYSETSMAVNTRKGKNKVTVEDYQKIVNNYIKPDIISQFSVDVQWNSSKKRATRVTTQNSVWLESQIKCTPPHLHNKIFAVIQGGKYKDLRMKSTKDILIHQSKVGGFILGSFGTGETSQERLEMLKDIIPQLPNDKPRLITGIGSPEEILELIELGIDCISNNYPNLMTEWGYALTFNYDFNNNNNNVNKINLWDQKYVIETEPIVKNCQCFTCRQHTRAYIHHLLNTHEMLSEVLLTIHNTYHYLSFFEAIRKSIDENRFKEYKEMFLKSRMNE